MIPDVLVLGPYPPPAGGISVHVQRLQSFLTERGIEVEILRHHRGPVEGSVTSSLKRNPVRYWLAIPRHPSRLVHYHHSRWSTLFAVALRARRDPRPYICTVHGLELGPCLRSRLPGVARLTRWALREFDELIAVSDEVARQLENVGHATPPVIPDYLPVSDLGELDGEAARFFEAHEAVVVCAYRVHLVGDGDLYGLDLAVEAFAALAKERPRLGLALFLAVRPRWRQRRYFAALVARLQGADLEGRTLVRFAQPLSPAFDHDVVYIRPTRSDGDAVSVREALERGVRVVASDVVARPAGTMVFDSGDAASLAEAVRTALHSNTPPMRDEGSTNGFASAEAIMRIYERFLSAAADGCQPLASAKSFG